MFLTDLNNPKKEFFLELLILLLMSERVRDIEYDDALESSSQEPLLLPFSAAIDAKALEIVTKAANTIDKQDTLEKFYDTLNTNPSSNYGSIFAGISSSIFDNLGASKELKENWQNRSRSYDFSPFFDLRRSLVDTIEAKIDEYSPNSHVRQAVIDEITQSGIDFFSINPKVIQIFTANLAQIRQEILLQATELLVAKKKSEGLVLSNREKKIYLYNLLFFCIEGNKDLEENKVADLLKTMIKSLELDIHYIQEFIPLVKQYVQIEQELVTLVNE